MNLYSVWTRKIFLLMLLLWLFISPDISLALLNSSCAISYIIKYLKAKLHILPKELVWQQTTFYWPLPLPTAANKWRRKDDMRRSGMEKKQSQNRDRLVHAAAYLDARNPAVLCWFPPRWIWQISRFFSPQILPL